jgi:PIN domain nuclease of toxin-antitoxin system
VLLLDTHIWIWAVEGDARRLGRRARQLIARAESQGAIRSTAAILELAAPHTSGRIRLARSLEAWIDEALAAPGVRLSPLSAPVAINAGSIPRTALADPLDRVLVATARQLDATLLTSDRRILEVTTPLPLAISTEKVRTARLGSWELGVDAAHLYSVTGAAVSTDQGLNAGTAICRMWAVLRVANVSP